MFGTYARRSRVGALEAAPAKYGFLGHTRGKAEAGVADRIAIEHVPTCSNCSPPLSAAHLSGSRRRFERTPSCRRLAPRL